MASNDEYYKRFADGVPEGYIIQGICHLCKYKHLDTFTCDAFPDRIPPVILDGEYDHHRSFNGDHGIQFEPLEE